MTDQNLTPHGQNIVVYDCEIKNVIDGKTITWNDHNKMGISVAVAFDYLTSEFKVFMDDNLEELPTLLNRAEIVSGFNIIGFDHKLVNGSTKAQYVHTDNTYDLLFESRLAWGWDPKMAFPKGMRLDDHLLGTFGPEWVKTADGAEAPLMWQRGELGRLISYCIDDVRRECMLFEHVWAEKPVITPIHGPRILRHPLWQKRRAMNAKALDPVHSKVWEVIEKETAGIEPLEERN